MATANRPPTSDISVAGTWSGTAGSRFTLVDDHPDSAATDVLTHGTTAGNIIFGFSTFSIPAGSTNISVQVIYYDYKNANQACNIAGRIRVGSATFANATSHNPGNGVANIALRTDNFATNPSGGNWTVDQINGIGPVALTGFGWISTDANPTIALASVILQVTYTEAAGPQSNVSDSLSIGTPAPTVLRMIAVPLLTLDIPLPISVSGALTIIDESPIVRIPLLVAPSDGLVVGEDTPTVTLASDAVVPINVSDDLSIGEVTTVQRLPVEDALVVGESSSLDLLVQPSVSDDLVLNDLPTFAGAVSISVTSGITIGETIEIQSNFRFINVTDGLTVVAEPPTIIFPQLGQVFINIIDGMLVTDRNEWRTETAFGLGISGSSVSFPIIPANCWVIGAQLEVLSTVTGVTGIDIGDSLDPQRFGANISPTAGTVTQIRDLRMTTIPHYGTTASNIILLPLGGNFTGGNVRVTVFYATLDAGLFEGPWVQNTTLLSGLSGSTATATALIPANSWVIGVKAEVVTAITGATAFRVGESVDPERWGTNLPIAQGTTTDIGNFPDAAIPAYATATNVIVEALGVPFTGGAVRVTSYTAQLSHGWRTIEMVRNLIGSVVPVVGLLPPDSHILGVTLEVTQTIAGVTGVDIGDNLIQDRWGRDISPVLGTQTNVADFQHTAIPNYGATPQLILTAKSGSITSGQVRLIVYYSLWTPVLNSPVVDILNSINLSDGLTVGDPPPPVSIPPATTVDISVADDLAVGEPIVRLRIPVTPSVENGVVIGENVDADQPLSFSRSDDVIVGDESTARVLLQPQVTDGLIVGEERKVDHVLNANPTDLVTVGDEPSLRINIPANATDDLVVFDLSFALVTSAADVTILTNDSAIPGEEPPRLLVTLLPSATSGLTVGEERPVNLLVQPQVSSGLVVGEEFPLIIHIPAVAEDGLTIGEPLLVSIALPGISVAENIFISDQEVEFQVHVLLEPSVPQDVVIADLPNVVVAEANAVSISKSDPVFTGDEPFFFMSFRPSVEDGQPTTEDVTLKIAIPAAATDGVELGEEFWVFMTFRRSVTQDVVVGDTSPVIMSLDVPTISNDVALMDLPLVVVRGADIDILLPETVFLGEPPISADIAVPANATSGVILGEASPVDVLRQPAVTDGLTLADDNPAVQIPMMPNIIQDVLIGDVPTLLLPVLFIDVMDERFTGEVLFVDVVLLPNPTETLVISETPPHPLIPLTMEGIEFLGIGDLSFTAGISRISVDESILVGENIIATGPTTVIGAVLVLMGVRSGIIATN